MTGAAAALVLMFAQPVLADGSFANGTSVNGVAVGGMSNEEAKAKLEQNWRQDRRDHRSGDRL